jgi:hypothetical protein
LGTSVRQDIVDAVKARFALISRANGYLTDIGLKQTEWHLHPKDLEDTPGHDVRDGRELTIITDKNAGVYERQLEVMIIAEVPEAAGGATETRKALADMIKAVGVDPKWGGLARRTLPVDQDVTVDDAGNRIGAARLTMRIEYSRAPWKV